MDIMMDARGATPEEKQRGLAAARAVIEQSGLTAEEAAEGSFAVEGWDEMGFPPDQEPSEDEYAAAEIWWAASNAAIKACCEGWPDEKRMQVSGLQLLHNPDVQLADRTTALRRMRAIIQAEDGRHEYHDDRVFLLALAATAEVPDSSEAQQLVSAVTVAYTSLSLARFHPGEPIEPKRQAVLDAIDALDAGSAALN
ncbi:hypothetical protein FJ420_17115 [Mesorhizobium sp. B3-1-3]|uniref:hypothetical protein n=1 Tax=unclassified Mesorhizobium TaxID=325217 RepID=UPI00112B61F6|nr:MULTISPECIES: hypothetical protein [unclassified Mesorhizobium]TPI64268.1 hypothetical protein FJ424_18045 [Mesorhizobium sp. B3-1-8]TPI70252.1 hypothetical protein FJ420_17115 [Mesorhizobium sp. B3-1-3]